MEHWCIGRAYETVYLVGRVRPPRVPFHIEIESDHEERWLKLSKNNVAAERPLTYTLITQRSQLSTQCNIANSVH